MIRLKLLPTLALSAAVGTAGCRLVETPEAVVASSVTAASQGPTTERWLESATLVCLPPTPPPVATAAGNIEQAAFATEEPVAATAPAPRAIQVLAIRYPHPDGRRDVARAELIVADTTAEAEALASWRPRLGRALSGVLPGVAWGPGIRRAVGLDVPVAEIQQIVTAAQQAHPADGLGSAPTTGLVRLEVNGQPVAVTSPSPAELQRLAERTSREGRLISYRGTASELLAATGR